MTQFSLPDYRRQVNPDRKVVKADEWSVLLAAQDSLKHLQEQLQQLRQENEEIYQRQKAAGYDDGLNEARQSQAEQIFSTAAQVIDYVASVERALVNIVMSSIRRVFNDYNDAEIVAQLVHKGLQQFRDQTRVRIYVPAGDNVPQMREKIEKILAPLADLALADIIESSAVGATGCRLESDMGSVESDLETLLQAMETALDEHFAQRH